MQGLALVGHLGTWLLHASQDNLILNFYHPAASLPRACFRLPAPRRQGVSPCLYVVDLFVLGPLYVALRFFVNGAAVDRLCNGAMRWPGLLRDPYPPRLRSGLKRAVAREPWDRGSEAEFH